MARYRTAFFAGLIILAPAALTWIIVQWLFGALDGLLGKPLEALIGRPVPGLGLVLTLALILGTGILAQNYLGRRLLDYGEQLVLRVPVVRGIYGTMKQLVDALDMQKQGAFQQVALIEYPRAGIYTLAFVTGRLSGGAVCYRIAGGDCVVSVFVPTTPNPTSGFLLYLPESDVQILDMSVADGLKLVLSGGVITEKLP